MHTQSDVARLTERVDALSEAVNALVTDPALAAEMGKAGRARAEREFGWDAIARRTVEVYGSLR